MLEDESELDIVLTPPLSTEDKSSVSFINNKSSKLSKLAIIGIVGRFPDASSHEELWELLERGLVVHREVPNNRFDAKTYTDVTEKSRNISHTPYGCWIANPGLCDPRQATIGERNAAQDIDTYFITGGVRALGPGRINYHFGFSGPSFGIDTACSSSAAAIQLACTSLWSGDCDTAIVGGVSCMTNPDIFAGLSRGQFLSKKGPCATFDNDVDGYCRADGIGKVIIKRLDDALSDNDNVLGLILGTATNHSADAVSITHPHGSTQEVLYRSILDKASVDPLDIDYVGMHGKGTQAGDCTEMQSVTNAFAPRNRKRGPERPLYLGAVKANIGHGEAASGVQKSLKSKLFENLAPVLITDAQNLSPIIIQVGVVCLEIALARLWQSWSIKPAVILGHSLGEYAVFCVSGVLLVSDTIYLTGTKAQLLVKECCVCTHTMIAVQGSISSTTEALKHVPLPANIACLNSTHETVLSGESGEMSNIANGLCQLGFKCNQLRVPFAFHSDQINPILDQFENLAGSVNFSKAEIPIISSAMGRRLDESEAIDAVYLRNHARDTVNFLGGLVSAQRTGIINQQTIWLEIGPHPVCLNMPGLLLENKKHTLSTTTIYIVTREEIDCDTAVVSTESDLSKPGLREVATGHIVNGTMICPSSLYADMAMTICNYAYKLIRPEVTDLGIDVVNMKVPKPLAAKPDGSQVLKLTAMLNAKAGIFLVAAKSICLNGNENAYLLRSKIDWLKDAEKRGKARKVGRGLAYELFSALVDYDFKYRGMEEVILHSDNMEATSQIVFQTTEKDGTFMCSPYWIDLRHYCQCLGCYGYLFADLGIDSLMSLTVSGRMREELEIDIHSHDFNDTLTIGAFKSFISKFEKQKSVSSRSDSPTTCLDQSTPNLLEDSNFTTPIEDCSDQMEENDLGTIIRAVIAEEMGIDSDNIEDTADLATLGLDSLMILSILRNLRER
ncbi:hypothetical protein B7463_g11299, partial [Scytalidium lignicola]